MMSDVAEPNIHMGSRAWVARHSAHAGSLLGPAFEHRTTLKQRQSMEHCLRFDTAIVCGHRREIQEAVNKHTIKWHRMKSSGRSCTFFCRSHFSAEWSILLPNETSTIGMVRMACFIAPLTLFGARIPVHGHQGTHRCFPIIRWPLPSCEAITLLRIFVCLLSNPIVIFSIE